jgi:hypothetical protein
MWNFIPILTREQIVILLLFIPLAYFIVAWAIYQGVQWNKRRQ